MASLHLRFHFKIVLTNFKTFENCQTPSDTQSNSNERSGRKKILKSNSFYFCSTLGDTKRYSAAHSNCSYKASTKLKMSDTFASPNIYTQIVHINLE